MQSSEATAKISPALVNAQQEFKAVAKSGNNTFDKYRYADLEDYVNVVRPILTKHGLAIVSSVDEVVGMEDRTTKNGGKEHAARVKVTIRIMHESGEWLETTVWGEGQDRADKAVYKAITGARKYGLACTFGLATSDDPERDENVGRDDAARPQRQAAPQKPIIPAAEADVIRFVEMLSMVDMGQNWKSAVLKKAGVSDWSEMPADKLAKCLEMVKAKQQSGKKELANA